MLTPENDSHTDSCTASSEPMPRVLFGVSILLLWGLGAAHAYIYRDPYRYLESIFFFFRLVSFHTVVAHLPLLVLMGLLWLLGLALGRRGLRALAGDSEEGMLDWPVALGLGWGALAYGVTLLTFCGWLSLTSLLVLLGVVAAVARTELRLLLQRLPEDARSAASATKEHWQRSSGSSRIVTVLVAWIVLNTFLSALMPPTQSDGLRYHLTVPKANLEVGGLADLPHFSFSKFPMTLEMLFTIPVAFGLPTGAKAIHLAHFAICLGLVARLCGRGFERRAGPVVLLTVPFVPFLATWTFIELGLTAYLLLAWYALRRGLQTAGPGSQRWLAVAAVASGLALGCKYTSAINHALLGFAILIWLDGDLKTRVRQWFVFETIGAVVASPWYIKNWILTGNPVYPLAKGIFGAPGWSAFDNAFYFYHAGEKGSLNALADMTWFERVRDLLTLPYRLTCPNVNLEGFGDWPTGVLLLGLLPVALYSLRKRTGEDRWRRMDFSYIAILFLAWAYTYRDVRFLLPCFAILTPHIATAIGRFWTSRAFRVTLTVAVLSQSVWMTSMWCKLDRYSPWPVVGGNPPLRGDFSLSNYPSPEDAYLADGCFDTYKYYPVALWIGENLPKDAVLYLHGLHTAFYIPRQTVWSDWFDTEPLTDAAREGRTVPELVEWLRTQGVTHVVYAFDMINEYNRQHGNDGFPPYYDLFSLPEEQGLAGVEALRSQTVVRLRDVRAWRQGMREVRRKIVVQARGAGTIGSLETLLSEATLKTVYEDEFTTVWALPEVGRVSEDAGAR